MTEQTNIFSIAPHSPFLHTLGAALLDGRILPNWPRKGPFWLSDITIFLPTRRARAELADVLAGMSGAAPLLLPDIRTLGTDDPAELPFLPPYEPAPMPPATGRIKRRLLLAQLVEKWLATRTDAPFSAPALGGYQGQPNTAEVLALAESLGTLIDDFAIAGKTLADLDSIETGQLAEQFLANLDFVRFVFELWPQVLAEEGEMDASARTSALIRRQASVMAQVYGVRPVVIAGSTGSMPATADLIAAVAALPNGAVVLPGLDPSLDDKGWASLRNPQTNAHGHPQYGLARLLDRLAITGSDVAALGAPATPKTTSLNAALALASETAHWPVIAAGLDRQNAATSISILEARTPEQEARAIAIAAHQCLEDEKTVAIIAPDQTLARRIAAELRRAGIEADDAAGTPLSLSRAGRLVRQAITLVTDGFAPVDLMAVLRNRHVALGVGRAVVAPVGEVLDFKVLRGQRPGAGLAGLKAVTQALAADEKRPRRQKLSANEVTVILALLDRLGQCLEPLQTLLALPRFHPALFADALSETLGRLRAGAAGEAPVALDGEDELRQVLETLARQGERGPLLDKSTLSTALDGLLAGFAVRPRRKPVTGVALYGRLEARLMQADRVILAGMVEGVWPETADPGPWLSRGMRMQAGLEPPEKLHGLAAHDFLMAMGAAEVVVTFSERQGTGPATPSRLVQRLEGFFGKQISDEMRARGAIWRDLAQRLDLAGQPPRAEKRPAPNPPIEVRQKKLRKLSVTDAETLLRSPYDIYAKYVLDLRRIDPLGADPDLAERGTIIHDIVGDFIGQGHDIMAPDAIEQLMDLARREFARLDAIPARRDLWLGRFGQAAGQFLAFERQRQANVRQRHAEIGGDWTFDQDGERFTLRGRADRIDVMVDNRLEIIDFKTGSVPSSADMKGYFAPQLPLEAVMAKHGGFAGIPALPSGALTYIKIGAKPDALEETQFALPKGTELDSAIATTFRYFVSHVSALLMRDGQAMPARVFPRKGQRFKGDYEHLARTGEWMITDTGEDEPNE